MPMPGQQLTWVRNALADHERRLAQLRRGIRLAEEEIAFEEILVSLARNDKLLDMVVELFDDASLAVEVARDPLGHCRAKGVELPHGVTLGGEFAEEADVQSVKLTALVTYGNWAMEIVWDSVSGLSATPPLGPPESLSARFMSSVEVPQA